jgi:hypothetical protein
VSLDSHLDVHIGSTIFAEHLARSDVVEHVYDAFHATAALAELPERMVEILLRLAMPQWAAGTGSIYIAGGFFDLHFLTCRRSTQTSTAC